MEAQPYATVIKGVHKGQMGIIVSKTDHYTKIRTADDTIIRCKHGSVLVQDVVPYDPGPELGPGLGPELGLDDTLLQEIILASMMEEKEKEKEYKQKQKQQSDMIHQQNDEYEMSLKHDLLKQEQEQEQEQELEKKKLALVFEEVSPDEMRRIRLLRFNNLI